MASMVEEAAPAPNLHNDDVHVPKENNACVMTAIETLVFETRPMPSAPEDHEREEREELGHSRAIRDDDEALNTRVIIAPKMTGLCGSDMHVYVEGRAGESHFRDSMVLGHEASGVIVGSQVTDLRPGDRVAMETGVACLRCDFCKGGQYEQCGKLYMAAADNHDGTLQGFYTLPAHTRAPTVSFSLSEALIQAERVQTSRCESLRPFIFDLDIWIDMQSMSLLEGVLVEPLACALMAFHNVHPLGHAQNVAVFVGGAIGLATLAAARALGARKLFVIDVVEERLKFARDWIGAETHLAMAKNQGESMSDYSKRHGKHIMEKFGLGERGEGIDVVVECSGAEVCVQTGIWCLKRRGTILQIGAGPKDIKIPMSIFLNKEISLKGVLRYGPTNFAMAIDFVKRGLVDLRPLNTHTFKFKDALEAFNTTKNYRGPDGKPAIKVVIKGPE